MKRIKQRRPSFVVTVSILASVTGCTPSEATSSDPMNEAGAFEAGEASASDAASGACGLGAGQNPPSPFPGDCPKNPGTPGTPCTTVLSGICGYERLPPVDGGPASCGEMVCASGTWCGAALDPTCVYPAYFPTVSWKPPIGFHQGKCSEAQVSAFVDCLGGLPDAATCKTFGADAANKTCMQCAATPSTAAAYGPLVEGSVTIQINEGGCIALASGDLTPTGCGAKLQALPQCEEQACEQGLPYSTPDPPPPPCPTAADQTVCKAFVDDAQCATALEAPGGVAAECVQSGATFADNAKAMVNLFCGAAITDGGDGG